MNEARRWADRFVARWPDTEQRRALAAGLGFGVSGALVALVIVVVGVVEYPGSFGLDPLLAFVLGLPLAAGLGAAVAGAPLWWAIVGRPDKPTARRGGLVGAVVGVVTHPLMWLLFGVGWGVVILVTEGLAALADSGLGGPGGMLGGFVVLSVYGLIFTGIVTVPVAAGTGVALARVRRTASGTERNADRRGPQDL